MGDDEGFKRGEWQDMVTVDENVCIVQWKDNSLLLYCDAGSLAQLVFWWPGRVIKTAAPNRYSVFKKLHSSLEIYFI
jgi:hypothetical protein